MKFRIKKSPVIQVLFVSVFLTSCVTTDEQVDPVNEKQDTSVNDFFIPDGFDFDMYNKKRFHIMFSSNAASGRVQQSEQFQYAIVGADHEGAIHGIRAGAADTDSGINLELSLPLHLAELFLYTKIQGNAKFFELTGDQLEIGYEDLFVEDINPENSNGRMGSTPNCTSFLGNATKVRCKNDEIILQSSASFEYVDVNTTGGDTLTIYPSDGIGSLNANQNLWTFSNSINNVPLSQVASFTVYALCRTAPKTVGLELVTFSNPCTYEEVDSDGDGIEDDYDVEPNNNEISAVTYIPAKGRYATFAFEDMWPYKGDYDFNDLVVSHNATIYTNASDYVTKIDYDFSIRAIGAKFNNDFCVSFSDPSNSLVIAEIDPSGLNYEKVDLNNLTEIRFAQFKSLFGYDGFINTDTSKTFIDPIQVKIVALFDGAVMIDDFSIDEYLRINQEEGRELHKPGVAFTSLMDQTMLGMAADDTRPESNKYFKTADNLPWVLEIPTEWEYPKEKVEIVRAYPNFKDFAQGKRNTPWYTDADGNKIHKHLYRK